MITNKQILEILIKYDPNPFMVQDTLELSDSQHESKRRFYEILLPHFPDFLRSFLSIG